MTAKRTTKAAPKATAKKVEEPKDLDPQDVVEQPDYVAPESDPTDPEVTDENDRNFVHPFLGATKPTVKED